MWGVFQDEPEDDWGCGLDVYYTSDEGEQDDDEGVLSEPESDSEDESWASSEQSEDAEAEDADEEGDDAKEQDCRTRRTRLFCLGLPQYSRR